MSTLLQRLLARYLTLGVEEPDEPDAVDAADEGTGDESLDDLLDNVEPPPADAAGDDEEPPRKETAAERRAKALEDELAQERSARRAAEARTPPTTPARDPLFDAEEQELARAKADGATPDQLGWLQWKIDGNRKMRANERNSSAALAEARNLADRTSFERLEITKPQVFKRYAAKVEKAIADFQAQGKELPPRNLILRMLIGDDIMNGTVKSKTAKAAPKPGTTVDRGRTPGTRSDVTAKGGQSDRDKRRARLENQII